MMRYHEGDAQDEVGNVEGSREVVEDLELSMAAQGYGKSISRSRRLEEATSTGQWPRCRWANRTRRRRMAPSAR
jgi:hypothetical protein